MKTVGIYDPYFHILGGAERYMASIASCLEGEYKTIFYTEDKMLPQKILAKFGIKLKNIETKKWPRSRRSRRDELKKLDILFYVTDGSLFISGAKKSILIIQSPDHTPPLTLINRVKFLSWNTIICYSEFMKNIIEKRIHKNAETLFVPITLPQKKNQKKENIVVSVGRFFPHLHNKKQHEMVAAFKELVSEGAEDAVLYLVGSVDPGAENYLETIQELAKGFNIKIMTQVSFQELQNILSRAKVYWHATGFGEDLNIHPQRAEHFGVSTIEAMSHGVVPITFAGGGQTEIIEHRKNGFLWHNLEELKKHTRELLQNHKMRQQIAEASHQSATNYSQSKFCHRLYEILQK